MKRKSDQEPKPGPEMKESNGFSDLDPVPHSDEPMAEWEGYDILAMIEGYESEGREILKAAGYPLTVREITNSRLDEEGKPLGLKPLPRRVRDVMNMLTYFNHVRSFITKKGWSIQSDPPALIPQTTIKPYLLQKDFTHALSSMAYGVQNAMKARIRPIEPLVELGKKRSQKQRQNREGRQFWRGKTREEIRARNATIRESYAKTNLSVNNFAKRNAKKYRLSPGRIRAILALDLAR